MDTTLLDLSRRLALRLITEVPVRSRLLSKLTLLRTAKNFILAGACLLWTGNTPMGLAQQNLSVLKPPVGAHVALFEFADLQCPMCARENPLLQDAAVKYHIPWLRHDFPLPQHNWSFQAAVNARWFDAQGRHLGDDYRNALFANQNRIETKSDLLQFTSDYARQHGVSLPFTLDPQGRLGDLVRADTSLAQSLGVHQTPTLWVVTDRAGGATPYTQVSDFSKLFSILDQLTAQTASARK
jgi:hypothetical protein